MTKAIPFIASNLSKNINTFTVGEPYAKMYKAPDYSPACHSAGEPCFNFKLPNCDVCTTENDVFSLKLKFLYSFIVSGSPHIPDMSIGELL